MPTPATALDPRVLHPDRAAFDQEVAAYLGHLRGRRLSPHTIESYQTILNAWARFMTDRGRSLDPLETTRRDAQAFIADQVARWRPATAASRTRGMGTFFRWMAAEWAIGGELRRSPFEDVATPTLPKVRVASLDADGVDALLEACRGSAFADLRDRAMFALMLSAGLRVGEVAALLVEDVDQVAGIVRVDSGKGERERLSAFGPVASEALRHYIRRRATHRDAGREEAVGIRSDHQRIGRPLFLVSPGTGSRGGMGKYGIGRALHRRSVAAGLGHVHPHQLRHTYAHSMLANGVPEGAVMAMGGWSSRSMLDRYGADLAQERAVLAYKDPLARADRKRR